MLSIRIKENEKSKGREGETRVRFARLRSYMTNIDGKKRRESHVYVIDDAEKKCLIFLIVR